jgi:hypothetical protein
MAIDPETYSHSIINEPSKLLTCKVLAAASQTFTVIPTVNLSGTSIGAGLRAIRSEATFRDLSTSIDSSNHRGHHRHASASVSETPTKGWHQTHQPTVPTHFSTVFLPSPCRKSGTDASLLLDPSTRTALGERSDGATSLPSILAARFTRGRCCPLTADLANGAINRGHPKQPPSRPSQ